jgi:hypothetical protein
MRSNTRNLQFEAVFSYGGYVTYAHNLTGGMRALAAALLVALLAAPLPAQELPSDPGELVNHAYLDAFAWSGFGGYEIGDATTQVLNIPVMIWLRHTRNHPWGLRLRLTGVFGVQKLEDIRDLGLGDIRAAALIPGLEFVLPLSERSTLRPYADVGAGWEIDGDNSVGYGSVGLWTEFVFPWHAFELGLEPRLAYRAAWRKGTQANGHGILSLRADARHPLWFTIGRYLPEAGLYFEPGYFIDGLEFRTSLGNTIEVDQQYEVGVGFSFRGETPKLWFIRIPYLGVGYRFGGDLSGLRIRIGGDRLTRLPAPVSE